MCGKRRDGWKQTKTLAVCAVYMGLLRVETLDFAFEPEDAVPST